MRTQALRLLRCTGVARDSVSAQTAQKVVSAFIESGSASKAVNGTRALSSLIRSSQQQLLPCSIALANALQQCSISTSVGTHMAVTEVAVDGSAEGVLGEIDRILSGESISAKDVADAAVALAYLQAKGDRLLWGKVFVSALEVKDSFDAASLTSFLWAATTAGVDHFKTIAELSGPVASLLSTLSATQVSVVVEALGRAGVKDAELFGKISTQAVGNIAKFKPAELARLLWGFAASHYDDGAFAKAAAKVLAEKASELAPKEAVQAIWALAKLRRTDKPTLDALVKATKGKTGSFESPIDTAALAWSLGFLTYKLDSETAKSLSAALKAGASDLTPSHAIDAAWGLAVLGSADKDAVSALFAVASASIQKDPTSVDVYQLGALYNASVLVPQAKLPEQVQSYALNLYNLGGESMSLKRSSAGSAFVQDLSEAVAVAFGARYRPEITKAVSSYARTTANGLAIDIAVDFDSSKIAIEPVYPGYTSATHPNVLLGPAVARAGLLEASGFKVVQVPFIEFASLKDSKAKAEYILAAVKAAVPGAKVDALSKKLAEPFNAYAE